jgi:phage-related minor tail protein
MGLADTSGELSEAAKLQARYAIILEQTGTAQGDFARTADGLANSQRILTAQLKDVGAALGVQLLPYALQFAQWASDMVAKFQSLSPEQQKWIMIIGGVVAVIGPLLMIVGTLITAIGAIIPVVTAVAGALTFPLIAIILAVIAVAALLYAAWKNNWGGIQEKTKAVIDFVKGVIEGGMQFIQDLTSGKLGALSQIWSNTWNLVKLVFNTVVENIKSIFALFQAAFSGDWTRFGEILREIWDRNWNLIGEILKTAWENIKLVVKGLINGIVNFFTTTDWASLGRAIVQGIVNGLISLASWALDQIVSFGQAIADVLAGFFGISSPSKLMEEMIGKPLAMGVVVGWKNILGGDPFAPALVGAMETPVVSMPALGMRGGGRSVMMQFTYAPAISLGDRFEAEQVLAPMIAEAVRRRLEQEG